MAMVTSAAHVALSAAHRATPTATTEQTARPPAEKLPDWVGACFVLVIFGGVLIALIALACRPTDPA